ncbi:hypothetical protein [Rhizobium leucaenae]|uniref:hypothetical protein n=1 Tax=Rhizobium leucaenae TaxID=29450 RepID=UPI00040333BE|nr:hypothetical protein [Rhizobium leucaenae]
MATPRRHQPATTRPPAANSNVPLLTIERAIADGLQPASLRQVAAANTNCGYRRERQADNLFMIADRLELLGYRYGRAA